MIDSEARTTLTVAADDRKDRKSSAADTDDEVRFLWQKGGSSNSSGATDAAAVSGLEALYSLIRSLESTMTKTITLFSPL